MKKLLRRLIVITTPERLLVCFLLITAYTTGVLTGMSLKDEYEATLLNHLGKTERRVDNLLLENRLLHAQAVPAPRKNDVQPVNRGQVGRGNENQKK